MSQQPNLLIDANGDNLKQGISKSAKHFKSRLISLNEQIYDKTIKPARINLNDLLKWKDYTLNLQISPTSNGKYHVYLGTRRPSSALSIYGMDYDRGHESD